MGTLIESALAVADATLALLGLRLDEKKGEYYYEETLVKRLVLGPGGKSGNCDLCIEAADLDWIDSEDVFEGAMGPEDEPPLHPNCTCSTEYKESRKRVYV